MFEAVTLIKVMEEERAVMSRLLGVILKEREGIVNCDPALLTECLKEKGKLKASLDDLEKKRATAADEKSLREIMPEADQEEQGKLVSLQLDLKVSAREARALSMANILLFKQSLSFMEQLWQGIWDSKGQHYNESGEMAGSPLTGKLVSSSA
ncbi:MAG: hypothetical protein C4554_04880 [Dethiobacter sp.]|jgi:flagellar biosynthesis/type III secretory pathway chaperone|nr:MAG: hypothetical protein C4554_04880 [Dethiobacter sp.]